MMNPRNCVSPGRTGSIPALAKTRSLRAWLCSALVGFLASGTVFPGALRSGNNRTEAPNTLFSLLGGMPQKEMDVWSLEQHADIYMLRKRYAEALEIYRQLIRLQPKNPVSHKKLGIVYHHLQDLESARRAYRRAIQLDSRYAQALNNLAAVEHAQEKYRDAIFSYLSALKLAPRDAVVYTNLGRAYLAHEKFGYAMESFRHALSLDPEVFRTTGRFGTIVQQRDEKSSAAFNFYMAKTYASVGNVEDTLQYLRMAWEEGFPEMREALQDKIFEFLTNDPQFRQILTDIEAAEKGAAEIQASP